MHAVIPKTRESQVIAVPFGGSYRECWSEDYRLSIAYADQKTVLARWQENRWIPVGGDESLCAWLRHAGRESIPGLYFQASAAVSWTLTEAKRRGLPLEQLDEIARFKANPLCAPELLRQLMDDCSLPLNDAFQITCACCEDRRAMGVEVEQVYPLQSRTAHVISVLRGCVISGLAASHSSFLEEDRSPLGAVPEETTVRLHLHVLAGRADRAFLQLYGDESQQELPMEAEGDGFTVRFSAPDAAALWYRFRIETERSLYWLCPREDGFRGRLYGYEAPGFRLTVYRKDFETPAWFRRCVMYQVFPDRFAFSDDGTAEKGIAYHRALGQTPELHARNTEPVRYLPRSFEKDYIPDDFYGGTLKGIEEQLPYLKELGIGCLYLNPIVEARSNHRYDASNYLRVDPILGSNEDFQHLCASAEAQGIRVILDGVFSHTGADSVYFNRWGHYPDKGACQGQDSPYYPWYEFKHYPDDYRCWWGFRELPEVEETNPQWQDFVVTGPDSVVKTWLRRGAAGWRLDVADELPDEVLALIRRAAREEKPDALILGEVWEDAVTKVSYGGRRNYALGYSLDTVMNYPLRKAVLDFAHGRTDAYALRDFLQGQQMNYPRPLYYSLMNLLGSHDVERLRSALATDVDIRALSRPEQMHMYFSPEELDRAKELEKLCAVLQFSLPGVPSIYYGDEQGMCGVCDPFNRLPFHTGDRELHDTYAALAALRNGAAALSTGEAVFAAVNRDLLLILRTVSGGADVFGEEAEDGAYLAVINRGSDPTVYAWDFGISGLEPVSGEIPACSGEIRKLK